MGFVTLQGTGCALLQPLSTAAGDAHALSRPCATTHSKLHMLLGMIHLNANAYSYVHASRVVHVSTLANPNLFAHGNTPCMERQCAVLAMSSCITQQTPTAATAWVPRFACPTQTEQHSCTDMLCASFGLHAAPVTALHWRISAAP
jgi:hypothetical protein